MDRDIEKGFATPPPPKTEENDERGTEEPQTEPQPTATDVVKPAAAAAPKKTVPQPPLKSQQSIRHRRSADGREVIEVHHHHHHMHPVASGGAFPNHKQWSTMFQDPMSEIYPMPIGAGTWANPVTQQTYQQSTIQNNFTWILGWCVCCPTTAICIIIWLVIFGIFTWDQVFRSPWG